MLSCFSNRFCAASYVAPQRAAMHTCVALHKLKTNFLSCNDSGGSRLTIPQCLKNPGKPPQEYGLSILRFCFKQQLEYSRYFVREPSEDASMLSDQFLLTRKATATFKCYPASRWPSNCFRSRQTKLFSAGSSQVDFLQSKMVLSRANVKPR